MKAKKKIIAYVVMFGLLVMNIPQIAVYAVEKDVPHISTPADEPDITDESTTGDISDTTDSNTPDDTSDIENGTIPGTENDIQDPKPSDEPADSSDLISNDGEDDLQAPDETDSPNDSNGADDETNELDTPQTDPTNQEPSNIEGEDSILNPNELLNGDMESDISEFNTQNVAATDRQVGLFSSDVAINSVKDQHVGQSNDTQPSSGLVFDDSSKTLTIESKEAISQLTGNPNYYSSAEAIVIAEGVTDINFLKDFNQLKEVTIPGTVSTIEENAFLGCYSLLEKVTIAPGKQPQAIANSAFNGCGQLKEIILPKSVTSIGANAFMNCSSLSSIEIPEGVTSIGMHAFQGCSSLNSITIPKSVTFIDEFGCAVNSTTKPSGSTTAPVDQLKEIRFEGSIPPQFAGLAFGYRDKDFLIFVPHDSKSQANENGQTYETIFGSATLWYLPKITPESLKRQPGQSASFSADFYTNYYGPHNRNIKSYTYKWQKLDGNGDWSSVGSGSNFQLSSITEENYGTYRLQIIAEYKDGRKDEIISDEFTLDVDENHKPNQSGNNGGNTGGNNFTGKDEEKEEPDDGNENPPENNETPDDSTDNNGNPIGGNSVSWIQGNNNATVSHPTNSSQGTDRAENKGKDSADLQSSEKTDSLSENGNNSADDASGQTEPVNTVKSSINKLLVIFILVLCFARLIMVIVKRKVIYEKNK